MLQKGDYESAYIYYLQAHHITHKIIPSLPTFQKTMQKSGSYVKGVYNDLLAFFESKEAQNTMHELENGMETNHNQPTESERVLGPGDAEPEPEAAQAPESEPEIEPSPELASSPEAEPEPFTSPEAYPSEVEFEPPQFDSTPSHPVGPAPPPPPNQHFKTARKPVNSAVPPPNLSQGIENLTISTQPQYEPRPDLRLPLTNVINAETLDTYMKTFPSQILIIDVRTREAFDAGRFPSENVICIDPYILASNRAETDLQTALSMAPSQEQALFEMRDQFELVVYHDGSMREIGRGEQQTPIQHCMQQLVDIIYSKSFTKPLKRSPCLLVGGLEAWVELTGDTLWKRRVMPQGMNGSSSPAPKTINQALSTPSPTISTDVAAFRTPQPPRGIPSREGTRKGSIVSIGSPSPVDGIKPGYPQDDYFMRSQGDPGYNVVNGIVRPSYSHFTTAAVTATAGAVAPPALAAFQFNGQQSPQAPYPHRNSMPALPSMSAYSSDRSRYEQMPGTYDGQMQAQPPPPHHGVPRPMAAYPPSSVRPPNQFQEFATGLMNLGNTCYMNCILQCLVGTTRLAEVFLNGEYQVQLDSRLGHKGYIANSFARLVRAMYQSALHCPRGQVSYISPKEMVGVCGHISQVFRGYEQQDCHEFLNFLLDGLHEDLNVRGNKPGLKALTEREEAKREAMNVHEASVNEWMRYLFNNESLISRHCQGQYLSRLECRVCGTTSTTYNPFSCLSIPIPSSSGTVTLEDCFKQFTQPELLQGDDAWNCPKCKKRQATIKTMRLSRLPDFLIIHLKRFQHGGGGGLLGWAGSSGGTNKLGTFVRYPVSHELDLLPYWLPATGMQTLSVGGRPYQSPPFRYRLYAVANHFGTLKGGHYTAYVKRGRAFGWCGFDDTRVRVKVGLDDVVNKNAYVLFYERV